MRIITGQAKGCRLSTLAGEETRPTAERAKEAIFSSLQFELADRRVLDLFGGSGQLGLEALSRGAASAMFVDASADAMAVIKENARRTGFFDRSRFLISDYRSYLRKGARKDLYSLVFLDPPYARRDWLADAVDRMISGDMAEDGCLFVCESDTPDVRAGCACREQLAPVKEAKYGIAHIQILRFMKGPSHD